MIWPNCVEMSIRATNSVVKVQSILTNTSLLKDPMRKQAAKHKTQKISIRILLLRKIN
jgi:hypothetical protein